MAPPEPDFDEILVPDSTDSPQNSPNNPSHLQTHDHLSDVESDPEIEDRPDPVPKLLFNQPSSPPLSFYRPSQFHDSHLIKQEQSLSNSPTSKDASDRVEEAKRQQLLLELGFDERINESVTPLSSSPIEIIQTTRSQGLELRKNEKKKQISSPRVNSQKNLNNNLYVVNESDDQPGAQLLASGSSHNSSSKRSATYGHLFATPQDQMRHIGVIVDDSDEDEGGGCKDSGIAPLMNSWPASKRTIFMRMAGLKTNGTRDEMEATTEGRAEETAEWDRLLNRRKSNTSATTNTFSVNDKKTKFKKSWTNRSYFRKKKKSSASKSFKSFPKSSSAFKKSK